MKLTSKPKLIALENENIKIQLLESGDVFNILSGQSQINLLRGNILDGMVSNIFMKLANGLSTPLLGVKSPSTFEIKDNKAYYSGLFSDVRYQVVCFLEGYSWVYDVFFQSAKDQIITLYYGQDLAIQNLASVLNSEPYTVQYIDYKVFEKESGYTLLARQNQGIPHMCQIGCTSDTVAYSTDGFQFFGTEYKRTNQPKALRSNTLASEIYQYEFSYFALQTKELQTTNEAQRCSFYGDYHPEVKELRTNPFEVSFKHQEYESLKSVPKIKGTLHDVDVVQSNYLNDETLFDRYTEHHEEEYQDGELLSFFTNNHHHVVMAQKELVVERPHGHIMIHGDIENASKNVMATTNFMYGVFHSHISLGNTTFNKFIGDTRNPLNIQKMAGLRLYIKRDNQYQLLGLPSYYDMGVTVTKWVYVLDDDEITVTASVDIDQTIEYLHIDSTLEYDYIVQMHVLMNAEEYMSDVPYVVSDNKIEFSSAEDSMLHSKYPELKYVLSCETPINILPSTPLLGTDDSHGLLFLEIKKQSSVQFTITASFDDQPLTQNYNVSELDSRGTAYMESWLKHLDFKTSNQAYNKLIDTAFWYTHNALVHYSSPHGLEQYNGAAWGTRDVCQGPAELFMASDRYDLVKDVLLKVYRRQFLENGNFPQWYMFDCYYQIQAHESHGDIIIWPLRLLAQYIERTNDVSVLNEEVEYMSLEANDFTKKKYTILEHVLKQIETIRDSSIKGTSLPKYGGGDWDDTLQPANEHLKEFMVSGWTVALLYETLSTFSTVIQEVQPALSLEMNQYLSQLNIDYTTYLLHDDVPVGFTVFGDDITHLIYPEDNHTNIHYRLLPYIRSIISGLADEESCKKYDEIIDTYLKHPDGVRLMDKTVPYHGGENTLFQRAETAANFGREIGLQYVHAHIRYIEAMFTMNESKKALHGLLEVCPINLQDTVPNAVTRQSNMYYSSSDACVNTRYIAEEKFHLLHTGDLEVKGGWRLYSSGPGIYVRQLVENMVGLSRYQNKLLINPISFETLEYEYVQYHFDGKKVIIHMEKGNNSITVNAIEVPFEIITQSNGTVKYLLDPIFLQESVNHIVIQY